MAIFRKSNLGVTMVINIDNIYVESRKANNILPDFLYSSSYADKTIPKPRNISWVKKTPIDILNKKVK